MCLLEFTPCGTSKKRIIVVLSEEKPKIRHGSCVFGIQVGYKQSVSPFSFLPYTAGGLELSFQQRRLILEWAWWFHSLAHLLSDSPIEKLRTHWGWHPHLKFHILGGTFSPPPPLS